MKKYNNRHPLVVIHIPKAAGTSSQAIFKDWYRNNFHRHYYDEINAKMPKKIDIFELHSIDNPLCLHGHFNKLRNFGIEDYYPEADQFITILRDPFELLISHYFYTRKVGGSWSDKSRVPENDIDSYLKNHKPNMLNHFPRDVNLNNYKEICEKYFIEIGITEKLNESLNRIANKIGFVYSNNVSELNKTERSEQIPLEFKEKFIELNQLEYEVYNYALQKHLNAYE